jgi:hypothetical protein
MDLDEIVDLPALMKDKGNGRVKFDKPLSQWSISKLGLVNDEDNMMTSSVRISLLKSTNKDIGYRIIETETEVIIEYGYREEDGSFKSLDEEDE